MIFASVPRRVQISVAMPLALTRGYKLLTEQSGVSVVVTGQGFNLLGWFGWSPQATTLEVRVCTLTFCVSVRCFFSFIHETHLI